MTLLLGTEDGVYRAQEVPFDEAIQVGAFGRVMRVRHFTGTDGAFAAAKTGLYQSRNDGTAWAELDVPRKEVYSVCATPNGSRLFAGTHPAQLYCSENQGDNWRELDGFQDLPSRQEWFTPRHRNEAHIRSLNTHPDEPGRVIAGVEVGGVHVSEDRGETWTERRDGVHDDVHHVLVRGAGEWYASCGDGLYRTEDAGQTWTRLDSELDHRYFREAIIHDGHLYAAAARSSPGSWEGETGADGGLFIATLNEWDFDSVSYPGQPEEVILAWAISNGDVIAGTNEGQVLRESGREWETVGQVPAGIRSLCVV